MVIYIGHSSKKSMDWSMKTAQGNGVRERARARLPGASPNPLPHPLSSFPCFIAFPFFRRCFTELNSLT
jgi:hypothetical protein